MQGTLVVRSSVAWKTRRLLQRRCAKPKSSVKRWVATLEKAVTYGAGQRDRSDSTPGAQWAARAVLVPGVL